MNDKRWADYNHHLSNTLREANFLGSQDPKKAYTTFMTNIANSSCFRKSTPSQTARQEPSRTWWNDDCNTVVKNAHQAFKPWCKSLFLTELRAEWKKAEAIKKRHIISAKKAAWSSFISTLGT
jgi:hypothetical protein